MTASTIPTRREFTKALAILSAGAAVPVSLHAAAAPDADAFAASLETVIRYRFGKMLTDEQVKKLQAKWISRHLSGEILKRVQLDNGEDPIVAFRADLP
ncbi:MAG: hypothetical protein K8T89_16675 [Planctomycetes bacterium]|nr:hypothetical protein [Planctomycetota bacterium]